VTYQPALFPGMEPATEAAALEAAATGERAFRAALNGWPFGDLPMFGFDLIMADPPWRFQLWSEKGEGKSAQAHYRTMAIEDIERLPVGDLAAPDCLLWLWCTAPMLPQQLKVMERWGFRYVTMGAWAKRTKHDKSAFGGGYVLRSAAEPFVLGKVGEPVIVSKSVRNLVSGQVREHSRKPEAAYAAAESLMPHARKVELFSRANRPGWMAFGDEIGKFDRTEKADAA
jgi:N6-adenosine-specific RNA methylase IME4